MRRRKSKALKNKKAKRTMKDSIFKQFFSDKANVARFYNDYHQDALVHESDIHDVTLRNYFTTGLMNDLGFIIQGRKIVLVEAQSDWDKNIIVRVLLYLIDTFQHFFTEDKLKKLHQKKYFDFPETEIYVVYTGKRMVPDEVTLKEFLEEGKVSAIDCKAAVLKNNSTIGIMKEYIDFCSILSAKAVEYGRTVQAIDEAMDECISKGIMVEFLQSQRSEIRRSTMDLWNQKKIDKWKKEIEREEGRKEGHKIGREVGHEDSFEVIRLYYSGVPADEIAATLGLPLKFVKKLTSICK